MLIGVCPDHGTTKIQSHSMHRHVGLLTEQAGYWKAGKSTTVMAAAHRGFFQRSLSTNHVKLCSLGLSHATGYNRPFWGNNRPGCWNSRAACNTAQKRTYPPALISASSKGNEVPQYYPALPEQHIPVQKLLSWYNKMLIWCKETSKRKIKTWC